MPEPRHRQRGKRCEVEDCTKSAQGSTHYCIAHGGGKRCEYEGCTKSAQGSTPYCKAHGGGKRCKHEGCTKSAIGGGTPYCIAHGGGKRCMGQACVVDKRLTQIDGYCRRCYAWEFPEKVSPYKNKNYAVKEMHVVNAIRSTFPDMTWVHNKRYDFVDTGECSTSAVSSRKKPDLLNEYKHHMIVVETDEHQHPPRIRFVRRDGRVRVILDDIHDVTNNHYSCGNEVSRMYELLQNEYKGRTTWFVRFNPDKYTLVDTNTVVTSCFGYTSDGLARVAPSKEDEWYNTRLATLYAEIDLIKQLIDDAEDEPEDEENLLRVAYLFYDGVSPGVVERWGY